MMLQPLKELKFNLIKGVFAKEHNFNHSTAFNEVSFNMKLKIIKKKTCPLVSGVRFYVH